MDWDRIDNYDDNEVTWYHKLKEYNEILYLTLGKSIVMCFPEEMALSSKATGPRPLPTLVQNCLFTVLVVCVIKRVSFYFQNTEFTIYYKAIMYHVLPLTDR